MQTTTSSYKTIVVMMMAVITFAFGVGSAFAHNGVTHEETKMSKKTTTIMVMKHLCNDDINGINDFKALEAGKDPVAALAATVLACPTTGLEGDAAVEGTVASERSDFDFTVKSKGMTQNIDDSMFENHKLCESDIQLDANGDGTISEDVCLDISHYVYENIPRGMVKVTESDSPEGYHFGTVRFTPSVVDGNNDRDSLKFFSTKTDTITLDTRKDTDGMIMLHVYNFENN